MGPTPMLTMLHRCCYGGALNLTYLALNFSHYVNGVAMRHGEVSRQMFGGYHDRCDHQRRACGDVGLSTIRRLFDRHIPGWRRDNFSLRYAVGIPAS